MNRALRILFSGVTLAVLAAGPALAEGNVYTCLDAHGNTLTSDRPIAACLDRVQRIRRVIDGAADHLVALRQEQDTLQTELELYQNDLPRAPAALRSNMEANRDAQDRTLQFIADQQAERNRINDPFNREGRYLAQLWRNAEAGDD